MKIDICDLSRMRVSPLLLEWAEEVINTAVPIINFPNIDSSSSTFYTRIQIHNLLIKCYSNTNVLHRHLHVVFFERLL